MNKDSLIKRLVQIKNNCPKQYLPNNKLKTMGKPKISKNTRRKRNEEIKKILGATKTNYFLIYWQTHLKI